MRRFAVLEPTVGDWLADRGYTLVGRIEGRGLANTKWIAQDGAGRMVVRVNEHAVGGLALARFEKAAHLASVCGAHGVPVPEVVEVGTLASGRPYSVVRWVDGLPADLVRDPVDRMRVWERVGAAIRSLHQVELGGAEHRFALGFDGESATTAWSDHVQGLVGILADDRELGLDDTEKTALAAALAAIDADRYPPGPTHGDLKLDNVLLDPDTLEVRAIVDWELARFVPCPLGEASTSTEPAVVPEKAWAVPRSEEERQAVLRGLGCASDADATVFAVGDVLMNLAWYRAALEARERTDLPVLRERLTAYVAGVVPLLARLRRALAG